MLKLRCFVEKRLENRKFVNLNAAPDNHHSEIGITKKIYSMDLVAVMVDWISSGQRKIPNGIKLMSFCSRIFLNLN